MFQCWSMSLWCWLPLITYFALYSRLNNVSSLPPTANFATVSRSIMNAIMKDVEWCTNQWLVECTCCVELATNMNTFYDVVIINLSNKFQHVSNKPHECAKTKPV